MSAAVEAVMKSGPVIPVLTIRRAEDAVPLARALTAGGVRMLEVTLRTPAALDAIRRIAGEVEDAVVGAGTVLTDADLDRALDAGAAFAVSPGLTTDLALAARARGAALLPGVATGSEIMRALELGFDRLKFFPAETSGGPAALKAFAGPFLQPRFCPTGGVTAATAPAWLALPNVDCVGGSWLAPDDAVAAGDWERITDLARAAAALRGA